MQDNSKKRQPDPEPRGDLPIIPEPSLSLYFVLCFVSFILVVVAFSAKQDWPGLAINLASGIVTAVIILIVVDRRLRANELRAIEVFMRDKLPKVVIPRFLFVP